ncbi:hypothetical protein SAMN06297251_10475 [Fulvimarina manganoxydans]|uniref:Uncharacterized protein n=1 Tax=Fulvimarina manganoxydans TaxID=937218 RepID=A0A1W2ACK2_9HYPH|nr:HAD domain-containing protein [Fulvimarina manganoxydans]SMC58386.1 hypothetical protein SAMN06297251_10475 [Fulvimarina manganoxydans]
MARKKLISIDFDGVLHSYSSGWQGAGTASDAPVPGALAFLRSLVEDGRFDVVISSSRCDRAEGREAIRSWLDRHLTEAYGEVVGLTVAAGVRVGDGTKPPAFLHVDDRCVRFEGEWPSLDEIDAFAPWNKKPAEAKKDGAAAAYRRLPIEVEAFQFVVDMPVSAVPDWFLAAVVAGKAYFYDQADDEGGERKVFDIELEQVDSQYPIEVPANAWVVRGATGSLYVLTDEEFRAGHQPIDGYDEDLAEISSRVIETADPIQTVSDVPVTAMMALHGCDCGREYFAPDDRGQCPACAAAAVDEEADADLYDHSAVPAVYGCTCQYCGTPLRFVMRNAPFDPEGVEDEFPIACTNPACDPRNETQADRLWPDDRRYREALEKSTA